MSIHLRDLPMYNFVVAHPEFRDNVIIQNCFRAGLTVEEALVHMTEHAIEQDTRVHWFVLHQPPRTVIVGVMKYVIKAKALYEWLERYWAADKQRVAAEDLRTKARWAKMERDHAETLKQEAAAGQSRTSWQEQMQAAVLMQGATAGQHRFPWEGATD